MDGHVNRSVIPTRNESMSNRFLKGLPGCSLINGTVLHCTEKCLVQPVHTQAILAARELGSGAHSCAFDPCVPFGVDTHQWGLQP